MVVSTFYNGSHSGGPTPENPRQNPPPTQPDTGLLTAFGSYDSHAVVLANDRPNASPKAGTPYQTVTWSAIRSMVESPAGRPKEHAQLVVLSSYAKCDGRTHAVQRQLGVFHGLAVDIDTGNLSIGEVVAAVNTVTGGARAEVYSSSSSAPDNRKWRVLIPLSPPVAGADYADTQLALFDLLGQHGLTCDVTLSRAAQPVFLPNVPPKRRGSDGQPIFYQYRHVDGHLLDLTPDHPIVKVRDDRRAAAAAERAAAATRADEYKAQRLLHVAATGDDFQPIQHFNDHHTVAEMLVRYGFKRSERGRGSHWQSPLSTSGSYSTEDCGSHWVTVSNWAHNYNVGRVSSNGNRWGDAFDLFAYFEHSGDRRAAAKAYADVVRPRERSAVVDTRPAPLEPRPVPGGTCRTLTDWRTEAAARRADVISKPGLHMDRSPTGSGKTHATVEALRLASTSLTVLPTHANVTEHVQTMREHGIHAVPFPELTPDTCQQFDVASRAQSLGLVAGAAVCPVCKFKDGCAYRSQTKAAESAAVRVATHERLRRSAAAAEGVRVVVIDESPETVLAPSLTVNVKQLVPVEQLAHAIKNHWYSTASYDQKAFAGSMLDVLIAVNATCADITSAGSVPVELTAARDVPENWQKLLFDSISSVGVDQRLEAEALTLVTKAATGELTSLDIVTDVLPTGRMNHYLVGSWRPAVPADASVILLDATGSPDDIAAVIGQPVNDCTPAGHLPLHHPVVQIADDISRKTSASVVAGLVEAFLAAHPGVKRVGIIGHKPHMKAMMGDDGLLGEPARERVAKWCWFGQGPDRASNDWHQTCDHLLILGTPRTNPGDYRRWLVQHGLRDAAARDVRRGTAAGWGARDWETVTTDGDPKTVRGSGYRDPDWHRAYTAVCRAALQQAVGRCRAIMPDGIPCTILSNEATPYPVAPSLIATPSAVRETVEIIRKMGKPADQPLLAGSAKTHIGISYKGNCASGPWQTGDCLQAIMGAAGIDRRAAQVRLQQCREAGQLVNPKRGWWGLPGAADPPVTAPKASRPAAATPPAVVTPPVQAVVISATGPTGPAPVVEVAASVAPVTTTATCTTTVPASLPPDDTLVLIDERSAIMEYDGGLDRDTADRLALEATLGRDVQPFRAAPPDDIVVAVDHTVLAVRSQPFVGQTLRRFSGTVRVIGDRDDPFTTGQLGNRKPRLPGVCSCGHSRWKRLPIHGGDSSRYDCDHCDKFGWYGKWYGDETDDHLPTPPPAAAPPGGKVCPVPIFMPSTGGQPTGPVSVGT